MALAIPFNLLFDVSVALISNFSHFFNKSITCPFFQPEFYTRLRKNSVEKHLISRVLGVETRFII